MSVFKPFISSDVTVSPLKVNKLHSFTGGSEITSGGIDRFLGQNLNYNIFVSGSDPTGNIVSYNKKLVYDTIKELYYSNFISGSNGSPTSTASFNPDGTITGGKYTPSYDNYLTTTLNPNREFPTGSNDLVGIYSIPSNIFGENIKPKTFYLESNGNTITDDGEGILYYNITTPIGNIIYEHGIIILREYPTGTNVYGTMIYGTGIYSIPDPDVMANFVTGSNITCSFQSTTTIHELQLKCNARQNEFNFSQNPTLVSGSSNSGEIYDFATGSYFNPYVTTVGLYNNDKELLAVAKLSQPLPLSSVTDTNIIVNLDL